MRAKLRIPHLPKPTADHVPWQRAVGFIAASTVFGLLMAGSYRLPFPARVVALGGAGAVLGWMFLSLLALRHAGSTFRSTTLWRVFAVIAFAILEALAEGLEHAEQRALVSGLAGATVGAIFVATRRGDHSSAGGPAQAPVGWAESDGPGG